MAMGPNPLASKKKQSKKIKKAEKPRRIRKGKRSKGPRPATASTVTESLVEP